MTTGAPPPLKETISFQSTKYTPPVRSVQTAIYNASGYIPHPLETFGQSGPGPIPISHLPIGVPSGIWSGSAGETGLAPGMPAWDAAHPTSIHGRAITSNR